jgi:hypothetical protein
MEAVPHGAPVRREDYLPLKMELTFSLNDFFEPSFTLIWPSDFLTSSTAPFPF